MNRWAGIGIALLLIVAIPAAGSVVLGAEWNAHSIPVDDQFRSTESATAQTDSTGNMVSEFDRVEFRIAIYENGSGRWTFQYHRTLENESERDQFREFANEFMENETDIYASFQRRAVDLTGTAEQDLDREMSAQNFDRDARITGLNDNVGVIEMEFIWTNFAEVEGNSLVVGDVFSGGLYIGPSQSLVIEIPDGFQFDTVHPPPDSMAEGTIAESDSVTWTGEQSFSDNRPRVVVAPANETDGPSPQESDPPVGGDDDSTDDPAETTEMPVEEGGPWMALAFGTVVLLGLAAAAAWRRKTRSSEPAAASNSGGAAGSASAAGSSATETTSEELLTDEDRVVKLLEENDGRMKQVNIVEETGWSKSKVSMLLSDMEEEGDITKLRVGRENIISLKGHEPEAARSPHDE